MSNFFANLIEKAQTKVGQTLTGIVPEDILTPEAKTRAITKGLPTVDSTKKSTNFFAPVVETKKDILPRLGQKPTLTSPQIKPDTQAGSYGFRPDERGSSLNPYTIIPQGLAQSGAKLALGVKDIYQGQKEPSSLKVDPTASKLEKNFFGQLFGTEEVTPFTQDVADIELAGREKLGIKGQPGVGSGIAFGGPMVVLSALDFTGFGGGKKAVVDMLLKNQSTDFAFDTIRRMVPEGVSDDVVRGYAERFAKTGVRQEVEQGLQSLDNLVTKTKPAGQRFTLGDEGEKVFTERTGNKIDMTPSKNLGPEDLALENKSRIEVKKNYPKLEQEYIDKFGKTVNTDNARELFPEYAADRSRSAAVHEPSSDVAKGVYAKLLKESKDTGNNTVLFTAGGTAAGKTTAVNKIINDVDNYPVIFDTNMNKLGSADKKVTDALKNGYKVDIAFVHADPEDAFRRMLGRAERTGRTVPLIEHANTHIGYNPVMEDLMAKYESNPKVNFLGIDNTKSTPGGIDYPLDFLRSTRYNEGGATELKNKLYDILEQEYKAGNISDKTYRGVKGEFKVQQAVQPSGQRLGAKIGEQPQQKLSGGLGGAEKESKVLAPGVGGRSISITEDGKKAFSRKPPSMIQARTGLPESKIIRTENQVLRKKIMDEARGSRAGFKAGERITKEQMIARFKDSRTQMAQLKSLVSGFISDTLPADARGKFLQAFTKDLTRKEAFGLFQRASVIAENIEKSKLIQDLKDLKIPVKGKESLAVDYQKKIIEIFKDFDFQKPTQNTISKLNSLKDYLNRNKEALQLHPELLDRINRLSKKPLKDMSLGDIKILKETVEHLTNLGELKFALKNKYNARVRENNLNKLLDGTVNRDPKVFDRSSPTIWERRKLEASRNYIETLHTPRVADYLDGFKGYQGENAKLLKRINQAEIQAKHTSQGLVGSALEDIQKLGVDDITEEMQTNITLDLLQKQGADDQVATLLKKYDLKEIPKLTEQEQKISDLMRKYAGQHTDEMAATYEEIENLPFQKVDNYFPLKYESDFNLLPSETINQTRFRTTKTEQGFTKSRVKGVERVPRTDFLSVLEESLHDQQWYLHLQPELEDIKYLVKSKEYYEKGGELASNFWKDYMDVVSRRGWSATAKSNSFLRERRINLNNAILGYKASTILMQPMAVFDAMALASTRYGPKASLRILQETTGSWLVPGRTADIVEGSKALQVRQGGEVAIAENFEKVSKSKGLYNSFKRGALKMVQAADLKTAAGVELGMEKVLKNAGIANPKEEAEFMMSLMQGSAEVSMRPLVLSKGEGARTWFTFQTFFLNRWGVIANDIVKTGIIDGKDLKTKMNALLGLGIIMSGFIAEEEARKNLSKLTGGNPQDRSALSVALWSIPSQIPYFGNIINGLLATGEASIDAPLISVFEDTIQGANQVITGKETDTKIRGGIKFAKGIAATEFGIPGTFQAADLIKNIFVPTGEKKKSSLPKLGGSKGGLPKLGGKKGGLPKLGK